MTYEILTFPDLTSGRYTDSGKVSRNLVGKVFGKLTVQEMLGSYKRKVWCLCLCECGKFSEVVNSTLISGNTKSCGCGIKSSNTKRLTTHGMSKSAEYKSWQRMLDRCYNLKSSDYSHYGARGIRVSESWMSFENFFADMGLRPENLTVERLDVNGPYAVWNCVWATRKAQMRNCRNTLTITYQEQTKSVKEWSEISGIPYNTLKARLTKLNYTPEECLTKEVKPGGRLLGRDYGVRRTPDMSSVARGFDSPLSKVPKALAVVIQKKYDTKLYTFSALSREYGISIETCSQICQRENFYNISHD